MIQRNPNRSKMNYNKDVTQNKKISDKFKQKTLLVNQIQYNKKKDKKE